MHYAQANQLTFPSFDAYSRQPSYKHCAVRLRKLEAGDQV
jgi:assimilatory nitrate reductase catalytic subunit